MSLKHVTFVNLIDAGDAFGFNTIEYSLKRSLPCVIVLANVKPQHQYFFQTKATHADKVNTFCLYLSRCKDDAYNLLIEFLQSSAGTKHIAEKLTQLEKNE